CRRGAGRRARSSTACAGTRCATSPASCGCASGARANRGPRPANRPPARPHGSRSKPIAPASEAMDATCPSSPCACSTQTAARSAMRPAACGSGSKGRPDWWPLTTAIRATSPPSPRPNATPSADWRWRSCADCRDRPAARAWSPSRTGSRLPPSPSRSRTMRRDARAHPRSCSTETIAARRARPHHRLRRTDMTRHRFVPLAALALGLACSAALAAPPAATLKDAYAGAFLVGTAMNEDMVSGRDARAQALVSLHFNAIAAENVMKAEVLHPEPDRWDFDAADAFVEFGERHDLFMVGHTLVWHNQTPAWFFQDGNGAQADVETMRERMRNYIHTVAGRYAGRLDAWDVVNEVIGEDGQYRDTLWTRAYGGDGDALVRDAFRFASEAAPDAALYYNDFNAWRPE